MPRHTRLPAAILAADALARHGVQHAREPSTGRLARFRLGDSEENLTRAETALGVLYLTLHGDWSAKRCAGVELVRDPSFPKVPPRVLFFRVDRLVGLSDAARAKFGACPAWFHRKESKGDSKLFQRIPEPPIEGPEVDEVIGILSGCLKGGEGGNLMSITGRTQTMTYGFHTAATYDAALASFTEDGYQVITRRADCTWPGVRWPSIVTGER